MSNDLGQRRYINVALHRQYARIGAKLLDVLTQEVMKAAGRGLMKSKLRELERSTAQ